ncbi:hypothetical protein BGW80DRAFT_1338910 [Lactifluus volemus]|nr:hypothetical protein BGW80DRAFT_1338910 [Lactifluus volemus]
MRKLSLHAPMFGFGLGFGLGGARLGPAARAQVQAQRWLVRRDPLRGLEAFLSPSPIALDFYQLFVFCMLALHVYIYQLSFRAGITI